MLPRSVSTPVLPSHPPLLPSPLLAAILASWCSAFLPSWHPLLLRATRILLRKHKTCHFPAQTLQWLPIALTRKSDSLLGLHRPAEFAPVHSPLGTACLLTTSLLILCSRLPLFFEHARPFLNSGRALAFPFCLALGYFLGWTFSGLAHSHPLGHKWNIRPQGTLSRAPNQHEFTVCTCVCIYQFTVCLTHYIYMLQDKKEHEHYFPKPYNKCSTYTRHPVNACWMGDYHL
jgi:hypothetical protein